MLNLSLNELKQMAKMRGIKDYKSMSKERFLSALNESKSADSEKNLHNARTKQIREEFNKLRDRFLKPKIRLKKKDYKKSLWTQKENKKNLYKSKIRSIMIMMISNTKE